MEAISTHCFKVLKDCMGCTLIMPAISVSNVGQLAVDLLIQSSGAVKVSNIWHEAFIPIIGAHPYKNELGDLCTEFEVYHLNHHKVLYLQFRSPIWQNKEDDFLNELVKWFKAMEVKTVVVLSSLYDHERNDSQLCDPAVRCCLCPLTGPAYTSTLRDLHCKFIERKDGTEASGLMTADLFLPGAGFTQSLHLKCIDAGVPCISFFRFSSDGDNTPEALDIARTLDDWLNVVPSSRTSQKAFIQPPSWRLIHGGPSPPELFP